MKMKSLTHCLLLPLILASQLVLAAESIDKQLKVDDNLKLYIKVLRGDVTIRSWDKQEVSIRGKLDELSEGFVVDHQGNKLTLEDKMPRQFNGKNKEGSSLIFMVPKSLNLTVKGLSADYQVSKIQGDIFVNSISGNINLDDLKKQVHTKTVSGNINASALNGKIKLATVSGKIKDNNSKGEISYKLVSGELNANSSAQDVSIELVSGDADIKLTDLQSLQVRTVSGDIELSLDSLTSKASLNSVSGDIDLTLTQDINASFKINGGPGGKIINQLTSDKPSKEKYSPTSYLKFKMGDAQADIDISTISGTIKLSN
ncbi:DUF4097 domain-containing protein [Shewanella sp. D64]|uniref:DUF4097 family beta strand repeat-containing protein n=1 Tax=unclassified Shewanella TaxID=196818 RepID=UPI0022BA4EF5|nr:MULTISPECIES: DUF4097 family beta strand repeat-containing protein [unclassified Shewanella]MEC4728178.1 DUF4097 domain-containing protein [Shewanella sp. D64]MEC4739975.1 DUF4097 domain-containing protein [Shewanella sp. E94]WBJ94335.1 DUF4097 domain-containing protein [Shewanella sp. MTB7]